MIVNHNEDVEEEEQGRPKHPGDLGIYNEEIEKVRGRTNMKVETLRYGQVLFHFGLCGGLLMVAEMLHYILEWEKL